MAWSDALDNTGNASEVNLGSRTGWARRGGNSSPDELELPANTPYCRVEASFTYGVFAATDAAAPSGTEDQRVSVEIQIPTTDGDAHCGAALRAQDAVESGYQVRMRGSSPIEILKSTAGSYVVVASSTQAHAYGSWHSLVADAVNNGSGGVDLSLTLNGGTPLTHTDSSSPYLSGRGGIGGYSNGLSATNSPRWRNFTVEEIGGGAETFSGAAASRGVSSSAPSGAKATSAASAAPATPAVTSEGAKVASGTTATVHRVASAPTGVAQEVRAGSSRSDFVAASAPSGAKATGGASDSGFAAHIGPTGSKAAAGAAGSPLRAQSTTPAGSAVEVRSGATQTAATPRGASGGARVGVGAATSPATAATGATGRKIAGGRTGVIAVGGVAVTGRKLAGGVVLTATVIGGNPAGANPENLPVPPFTAVLSIVGRTPLLEIRSHGPALSVTSRTPLLEVETS